ncbi:hypothetical protein C5167_026879 [Papaver somniferum]|nr:hypothetical protein C5167_026879 [Papaver somniferum]
MSRNLHLAIQNVVLGFSLSLELARCDRLRKAYGVELWTQCGNVNILVETNK